MGLVTHTDQAIALLATDHDLTETWLQFKQLGVVQLQYVRRDRVVVAQLYARVGVQRANGQRSAGTAQAFCQIQLVGHNRDVFATCIDRSRHGLAAVQVAHARGTAF